VLFGTALGYILPLDKSSQTPTAAKVGLIVLISIFGAGTSLLIRAILKRHHQWAAWSVYKYRRPFDDTDSVYPKPTSTPVFTEIKEFDAGYIGNALIMFCNLIAVAWMMIAIIALLVGCPWISITLR
jgi:hypothetical protein